MDITEEIKKLDNEKKVLFAFIYGSRAKGTARADSDTDIAVYHEGDKKERFNFLKKLLGNLPDDYDVHIFQELPSYVRKEVIKHGKVFFSRDEKRSIAIIIENIRETSRMEKYMRYYRERVERDIYAKI